MCDMPYLGNGIGMLIVLKSNILLENYIMYKALLGKTLRRSLKPLSIDCYPSLSKDKWDPHG